MKLGIVLMTALLPTKGHINLIKFAADFMYPNPVIVIINSLPEEPIDGYIRVNAIKKAIHHNNIHITHIDYDVPQNPAEHPQFWDFWSNLIEKEILNLKYSITSFDEVCIIASEKYGHQVAENLKNKNKNSKFIPYDINREILNTKSTNVRQNIIEKFDEIIPEMRPHLVTNFTFFGAESCGKTIMTRTIAKEMNGHYIPEWARLYLEEIGPTLNEQVMMDIVNGEFAVLTNANNGYLNKPYIFRDTDLVSTLGYYRILKMNIPEQLYSKMNKSLANHYIVMNSKIPFEPDILRYGGNKRESTDKYWIDLLEELKLTYYYVKSTNHEEQKEEIKEEINRYIKNRFHNIIEYTRR